MQINKLASKTLAVTSAPKNGLPASFPAHSSRGLKFSHFFSFSFFRSHSLIFFFSASFSSLLFCTLHPRFHTLLCITTSAYSTCTMLPAVLLSLVAAVSASNYTFPNGFSPDQVELATRCNFFSSPLLSLEYDSILINDQRLGVRPSVVCVPRSAVELPMITPVSRYVYSILYTLRSTD